MRKLPAYLILLTALCIPQAEAAKYAGEAFSLGVGGRGLALGGAVIAGPFDATAAYWNPAGMNRLSGRYLVFMHAETFGSLLNHDYISYVNAGRNENSLIQSFGFYIYYLGGGGIKITELDRNSRPRVVREESHGDFLFAAALSGKIAGSVDFGMTAKIIYRNIATESGYGLTADAGVLYQPSRHVTLALMVTDITSGIIRYSGKTFDDGANYESIIPTVKPGITIEYTYQDFTGRLMSSGDIKFENLQSAAQYWSGSVSLDTHYGLEIGYREMAFGRVGFDISRFTAGGGVSVRRFSVDFAYLHHSDLDETFRVSVDYHF
jgi:hypothetical protein